LARVLRPDGVFIDYDLRFAPFGTITETASERGFFEGDPVVQPFPTGIPLFPKVRRLTLRS
jgi:hypothetical protein